MKILQLCKKFPYPLKDGESIAVNSLSKSFHELGCEITLLAMNTSKHYFDLRRLPEHFNHYAEIHTTPLDNRVKPLDAFFNLFSKNSYHVTRFESAAFRHKLIALLQTQQFDLIQLETLYLAPYIPLIRQYSDAIIAMRAHNVEHEIWERITENTKFLPKKWYLQHLTKKLKHYEIRQFSQYDILLPISERDLAAYRKLGYKGKAVVTPIGINANDYKPDYRSFKNELSLGFIGSLDWMPNQEGLKWFLDNVWTELNRRFPALKFHIAGRNTPDWIKQLRIPNIMVHGEVPNAAAFINNHTMMIVPLFSGSGMRVKILEGMALGRVVLTTSLGLEGIHAQHQKEVVIADTPDDFVNVIARCLENPLLLHQISHRARAFAFQHYDNREIAINLLQTYSQLFEERFGIKPYLPLWQTPMLSSASA
ncbi:MAG: glycosyltransferase family 4 protein [Saprospiraceae bacterium]|nr:glycosyltransferase family 4 protein [Saprospiraceae bacterium]